MVPNPLSFFVVVWFQVLCRSLRCLVDQFEVLCRSFAVFSKSFAVFSRTGQVAMLRKSGR